MAEKLPEDPAVLAAIIAAVDQCWPRPVFAAPDEKVDAATSWRFSGRWWRMPAQYRRERPWG